MMNKLMLLIISSILVSHTSLAEELSKNEQRAVVEKYIEAWDMSDFDKLRSLYLDPSQIDKNKFRLCEAFFKRMKIRRVRGQDFLLEIVLENKKVYPDPVDRQGVERGERWLQITPEGKIKYDSILVKHPVQFAFQNIFFLNFFFGSSADRRGAPSAEGGKQAFNDLKSMGVPIFDLDLEASEGDVRKELEKIRDWLIKNGDTWDISEPQIKCPKDLFQAYKDKSL